MLCGGRRAAAQLYTGGKCDGGALLLTWVPLTPGHRVAPQDRVVQQGSQQGSAGAGVQGTMSVCVSWPAPPSMPGPYWAIVRALCGHRVTPRRGVAPRNTGGSAALWGDAQEAPRLSNGARRAQRARFHRDLEPQSRRGCVGTGESRGVRSCPFCPLNHKLVLPIVTGLCAQAEGTAGQPGASAGLHTSRGSLQSASPKAVARDRPCSGGCHAAHELGGALATFSHSPSRPWPPSGHCPWPRWTLGVRPTVQRAA